MFFYYKPETKEVAMRSEGKIETDFPFIEYDPDIEEQTKIDNNFKIKVEQDSLVFIPTEQNLEDEKQQAIEEIKQDYANGLSSKLLIQKILEIL